MNPSYNPVPYPSHHKSSTCLHATTVSTSTNPWQSSISTHLQIAYGKDLVPEQVPLQLLLPCSHRFSIVLTMMSRRIAWKSQVGCRSYETAFPTNRFSKIFAKLNTATNALLLTIQCYTLKLITNTIEKLKPDKGSINVDIKKLIFVGLCSFSDLVQCQERRRPFGK